MSFLNSINNNSKKFEVPFIHWELNQPLTDEQINEIITADIDNPIDHNHNYDAPTNQLQKDPLGIARLYPCQKFCILVSY